YGYLIPTLNLGVQIVPQASTGISAVGVVDILRPSLPCLWCKQVLSAERIATESVPKHERLRLADEGYVRGLNERAPMVISLTSTVASLAVTEFLHLLTGFLQGRGAVQRLNFDAIDPRLVRGSSQMNDGCHCQRYAGYGDLRPLDGLA